MPLRTLSNRSVSRLGLASQYLKEPGCVAAAFERGINYFFSYNLSDDPLADALKPLLKNQRQELFIATGSEARQLDRLQQFLDLTRQVLQIDTIDAFFLEYLAPKESPDAVAAALDLMQQWKEQGLIRYAGVSTHNWEIALQMIQQRQCDVLMLRYNMVHRKVEAQVLPEAQAAGIGVIAFTCTRWGRLLKGHPQWQTPAPTAADCYRYALHHPAVEVALSAPATRSQLEENLAALDAPPMAAIEVEQWQAYGDLVYGDGQDRFETEWP